MKKLLSCLMILVLILAALPLTSATARDDDVFVTADGVTYQVRQDEIFQYVYYLSTGEKLCSLQGEFFYDKAALELIIPENEDELEEEMIFGRLRYVVTLNEISPGHLKYNASSASGYDFSKDTSVLIRAQFRVIASQGDHEIRNVLHTVAGADEHCYLYDDEVLDPLKKAEGDLPEKTPCDPDSDPTEPPTPAPTDPPTEPPTQAPTPAPTDPPTEPPTQTPTPAPTDPPTEPPTQTPTPERVLTDAATGIQVVTYFEAQLSVREISAEAFSYYLHHPEKLRILDISLLRNGTPLVPDKTVRVMFPSAYCRAVYRFDTGEFTGVPSTEEDGYRTLTAAALGLFVTASDDALPKATMYGNVDGDDAITITDVSFIQRDLAGIEKFSAEQKRIADVDGDGDMTITDATYIQRWLAGLLADNPLARFGYPRS